MNRIEVQIEKDDISQSQHFSRLPECIQEQLLEDIKKKKLKKELADKIKALANKRKSKR